MAEQADVRGTEYLVLEQQAGPSGEEVMEFWVECETLFARSGQDAIAKHVRSNGDKGGRFAAVPTRSWHQITVATETQTRLTFS